MSTKQDKTNTGSVNSNESDPTIRREFPGAQTHKEKIEAGKRNANNNENSDKKVKIEDDVPANDGEPVEEKSSNL